jgi:hypothetical protein
MEIARTLTENRMTAGQAIRDASAIHNHLRDQPRGHQIQWALPVQHRVRGQELEWVAFDEVR